MLGEARKKGVRIIVMGTNRTDLDCDVMIRTDYFEIGRAAGAYFLEHSANQPVNLLEIQGVPRSQPSKELQRGFRSALQPGSDISVPYIIAGYDSFSITQQRFAESGMMKTALPLSGVFAHSDEMTMGAAHLLRSQNRSLTVVGVSCGYGSNNGMEGVHNEVVKAVVFVPSGGEQAFSSALGLLEGKTVEPDSTLPITVIHAASVSGHPAERSAQK